MKVMGLKCVNREEVVRASRREGGELNGRRVAGYSVIFPPFVCLNKQELLPATCMPRASLQMHHILTRSIAYM